MEEERKITPRTLRTGIGEGWAKIPDYVSSLAVVAAALTSMNIEPV